MTPKTNGIDLPRAVVAVGLALLFVGGLGVGLLLSSPGGSGRTAEDAGAGGGPEVRAAAAGLGGRSAAGRAGAPAAFQQSTGGSASALDPSSARHTATVEAAQRVGPSVVSVVVAREARPRSLWDYFYGQGNRTVSGLGSGFAINEEGYVLTNNHVVGGADSIAVIDFQGRRYPAELVGADELTDIAVLRVPPGRIPPAPLGTSSDLVVGEPAIAIGNPSGFLLHNTEPTVTTGVVSGVGRDIRASGQRDVLYADMVQTDAAINPGNSGGPLVNAIGEVIGVNSSILSRSGGSEGLGFAIPIDRALRIAEELRVHGRIRRAWVGADVASVQSDSLAPQPVIERVAPGSPAARAGLERGDELIALDGRRVRSPLDWEVALLDAGVNSEITLRYRRDGDVRETELRVEELPSERADRVEVLRGLELVSVTPQIAAERRVGVDQGALIVAINPSTARSTGMRSGDIILAVNGREVRNAGDAAELFRYYSLGRGFVRVWLYRDGATMLASFYIR